MTALITVAEFHPGERAGIPHHQHRAPSALRGQGQGPRVNPAAARPRWFHRDRPAPRLSSDERGTEEERAHSTIRSYLAVTSMCSHSGPHGHQRKTPPQVGPGRGFQRAVRLGELRPGLRTERRRQNDTPKEKTVRAPLPNIAQAAYLARVLRSHHSSETSIVR